MNLAEAERYLQDNDIEYVRMEQTDLHGLSRSKTVPVAHFGHFAGNGLNFFGGLLGLDLQSGVAPGTGYMEERQFADQVLRPDLDTLAPIPWVPATAKVIGEPYWYGAGPAEAGPRFVLRRLIDRLGDMGYTLRSGFEYEFYLADAQSREPAFSGIQIFWTLRNNFDQNLMGQLLAGLRGAGLDVITSNAEYGPGQMEINLEPAEGIAAADHAFTFKNAIKEMARLEGYLASFMTKPYSDQSASGCHYHHGLRHARSGANAFVDNRGELSELARHWIGGLLAHAPALASLGSPTVNCGKRFRLFSFAPMNATWGFEDRTAAVRVKGGSPHQTHVENRIPGAAANPYLAAAATLAAGLDGIERKLEPPPAQSQIAYLDEKAEKLPVKLDAALEALEADSELRPYLGDELLQVFLAVKRHEITKARDAIPVYDDDEWQETVTDWERENMFEYL